MDMFEVKHGQVHCIVFWERVKVTDSQKKLYFFIFCIQEENIWPLSSDKFIIQQCQWSNNDQTSSYYTNKTSLLPVWLL